jgi:hypothetical protein
MREREPPQEYVEYRETLLSDEVLHGGDDFSNFEE